MATRLGKTARGPCLILSNYAYKEYARQSTSHHLNLYIRIHKASKFWHCVVRKSADRASPTSQYTFLNVGFPPGNSKSGPDPVSHTYAGLHSCIPRRNISRPGRHGGCRPTACHAQAQHCSNTSIKMPLLCRWEAHNTTTTMICPYVRFTGESEQTPEETRVVYNYLRRRD